MSNPEQGVSSSTEWDWREEEEKKLVVKAHEEVAAGALDTTHRSTELEPSEVETRIRACREYLRLILETSEPISKDRYYADRVQGIEPSDTLTPKLQQVLSQAWEWGLTEREIYDLSDNPKWQTIAFNPSHIKSPLEGADTV